MMNYILQHHRCCAFDNPGLPNDSVGYPGLRERFAHSLEMSYFRNSSIMGKHENNHEKSLCKFIKTINYAHKHESTTKPTNIKQRKKKCLVTI